MVQWITVGDVCNVSNAFCAQNFHNLSPIGQICFYLILFISTTAATAIGHQMPSEQFRLSYDCTISGCFFCLFCHQSMVQLNFGIVVKEKIWMRQMATLNVGIFYESLLAPYDEADEVWLKLGWRKTKLDLTLWSNTNVSQSQIGEIQRHVTKWLNWEMKNVWNSDISLNLCLCFTLLMAWPFIKTVRKSSCWSEKIDQIQRRTIK